jgi:uncharacterized protein YbaR (Trm112 family)
MVCPDCKEHFEVAKEMQVVMEHQTGLRKIF